ncbi:MAG: hypothetical protein LUQ04_09940 [Methanoregula sp.]|nr:hypothetical protein [Methanoregula sp.]
MVPEDFDPAEHPAVNHPQKEKKGVTKNIKKQPARQKKVSTLCVPAPEDIPGEVKCNYPEWQKFLERYPMINSIQREDFPDQGVSFVYVAHFYRTKNNAEESSLSQGEFEDFFKEIGYEYDYSGNFESRWYEGIGIKFN